MVKQIWDNELYLLIKYIKSVLWRVAKRLSYIEDARGVKVKVLSPHLLGDTECNHERPQARQTVLRRDRPRPLISPSVFLQATLALCRVQPVDHSLQSARA